MKIFTNYIKGMSYKRVAFYILLGLCFVISVYFVHHNHSFYDRTIAEVIKTNVEKSSKIRDEHQNHDKLYTQHIVAKIKNGEDKGKFIHLTNEFTSSGAYDQEYVVGNELFVSIDKKADGTKDLTGTIKDVKRDKYVLTVGWIFIFILLFVAKKQGLFSIISLVVNAILLSYALDIYLNTSHISLLFICSISAILFTVISLLLVSGFKEKTYAAIIATLLGTFITMVITYFVMKITMGNGLRYEEMQFLTRPPQVVFIAGVLVGSLGAVMDVAITMSSSLFELYEKNNDIPVKALKASGRDIGKDVMGIMTNILFFAYISGSIPMLILYFKNSSSLSFTLSMNLSLEIARALAGGIGIVLTIPIALYTTIFFINRKRERV